ncbi:MAG: RDD family protein [Parvibaculaceae bacterium]|nr:RDD family protein [Parvibaculaceae bacterium]
MKPSPWVATSGPSGSARPRQRYRAAPKKGRIEVLPPEGVPLHFDVAGIGGRFWAQIFDLLITHGSLALIFAVVIFSFSVSVTQVSTLFILLMFGIRAPYYILTELVWNGRTIGKRITGLRVISADGQRLQAYQIVVRNLMKELEVFLPILILFGVGGEDAPHWGIMLVWLFLMLATPFFQKRNQRIGDLIAGTYVITLPKTNLSVELADTNTATARRFEFSPSHLEHYGRFELQTLETILRNRRKGRVGGTEREQEIVSTICKKIGFLENVAGKDADAFLSDFYTAQRAFLEGRNLLGDKREDKFHDKNS